MSALSLSLDTPALAEHYEKASVDRQVKAGKQLIEKIDVRPGQTVLVPADLQERATREIVAELSELRTAEGFVVEGARIFAVADKV